MATDPITIDFTIRTYIARRIGPLGVVLVRLHPAGCPPCFLLLVALFGWVWEVSW